jgi:hypothetical protein
MIFLLELGTVLAVWYVLFEFLLLLSFIYFEIRIHTSSELNRHNENKECYNYLQKYNMSPVIVNKVHVYKWNPVSK